MSKLEQLFASLQETKAENAVVELVKFTKEDLAKVSPKGFKTIRRALTEDLEIRIDRDVDLPIIVELIATKETDEDRAIAKKRQQLRDAYIERLVSYVGMDASRAATAFDAEVDAVLKGTERKHISAFSVEELSNFISLVPTAQSVILQNRYVVFHSLIAENGDRYLADPDRRFSEADAKSLGPLFSLVLRQIREGRPEKKEPAANAGESGTSSGSEKQPASETESTGQEST